MSFFKKLFGIKNEEKKPANKETQKPKYLIPETQTSWVSESILQYVSSPSFQNELEDFKESNCLFFNNEEESTHEQYNIFKKYITLVESKLSDIIKILGVTNEEFCQAAYVCYTDGRFRKLVEELFSIDDFVCFRKMMVHKNRCLELEMKQQNGKLVRNDLLNREKTELEQALALSKRMYKDYLLELDEEQKLLEEALRISKQSYENELNRIKGLELENERIKQKCLILKEEQKSKNKKEIDQKAEELKMIEIKRIENLNRKTEIQEKLEKEKQEIEMKMKELLKIKDTRKQEEGNDESAVNNEKINLGLVNTQTVEETAEERKERMTRQRESLIKQRKEERDLKAVSGKFVLTKEEDKEKQLDGDKLKHKQIYQELIKEKVF